MARRTQAAGRLAPDFDVPIVVYLELAEEGPSIRFEAVANGLAGSPGEEAVDHFGPLMVLPRRSFSPA